MPVMLTRETNRLKYWTKVSSAGNNHPGKDIFVNWWEDEMICKNFYVPAPEKSREHEPKAIIENKEVTLTSGKMIPSSVNTENKSL